MKRISYSLIILFSISFASCMRADLSSIKNGVKQQVIKCCNGLASGCSQTLLLDNADDTRVSYEQISGVSEMPAYSWDSKRMLW